MIIILLSFNACSSQKNNSEYVTARAVSTFSELNDTICWTTGGNLFLENNDKLKNSFDYHLDDDPQYGPNYSKPLLVDNYLYYVNGVNSRTKQEFYIARIDYTIDEPKYEKLTETYGDIIAYTVCDNYLYYTTWPEPVLYRMNLLTKKISKVMEDPQKDVFCTNGDKIIIGNLIFDIKSQKGQLIPCDENLYTLGVNNNKYYCYYEHNGNCKILQINLNDNSIVELCEIPFGMDVPQMFGDKILFADLSINCVNVGYYYYDIPTDTIVTVIDSDNSNSRYTEENMDPIHYDYIIHNNMYYFHYYADDIVTRMNLETKKEELFCSVLTKVENGYSYEDKWLTYDEYLKELNNGNL